MSSEMPAVGYWDAAAADFDDEPDHGLREPGVRAAWAARLRAWLPEAPCDVLDLGCGTGSLALLALEQGHRVTGIDFSPRMVAAARAKLAGTGARVMVGDAAAPAVGERRFDVVLARHLLWALPDPAGVLDCWSRLLRPGGRLVLVEGRWGEAGVGGPGVGGSGVGRPKVGGPGVGGAAGCGPDDAHGGGPDVRVPDPARIREAGGDDDARAPKSGVPSAVGLSADALARLVGPWSRRVFVEQLARDTALWGRAVSDERYVLIAHLAPPRRHTEVVDGT
jgi:SAM-dependent methyltransferase